MLSLGWPGTWPIAAGMALMFYGFWHWFGLELIGWLSVTLAVLAFGMVLSIYPLGSVLLFLVSLLVCLLFVGWEAAVVVGEGWRAWRRWRIRCKGVVGEGPRSGRFDKTSERR
jgi:hypothetical protein